MRFRRSQRLPGFQAQAEGAGRQKRNPDDVTEYRAVLVPADRGAGRVFGDEDLLKAAGRDPSEAFRPCADAGRNSGMSSALVRPPPLKS